MRMHAHEKISDTIQRYNRIKKFAQYEVGVLIAGVFAIFAIIFILFWSQQPTNISTTSDYQRIAYGPTPQIIEWVVWSVKWTWSAIKDLQPIYLQWSLLIDWSFTFSRNNMLTLWWIIMPRIYTNKFSFPTSNRSAQTYDQYIISSQLSNTLPQLTINKPRILYSRNDIQTSIRCLDRTWLPSPLCAQKVPEIITALVHMDSVSRGQAFDFIDSSPAFTTDKLAPYCTNILDSLTIVNDYSPKAEKIIKRCPQSMQQEFAWHRMIYMFHTFIVNPDKITPFFDAGLKDESIYILMSMMQQLAKSIATEQSDSRFFVLLESFNVSISNNIWLIPSPYNKILILFYQKYIVWYVNSNPDMSIDKKEIFERLTRTFEQWSWSMIGMYWSVLQVSTDQAQTVSQTATSPTAQVNTDPLTEWYRRQQFGFVSTADIKKVIIRPNIVVIQFIKNNWEYVLRIDVNKNSQTTLYKINATGDSEKLSTKTPNFVLNQYTSLKSILENLK